MAKRGCPGPVAPTGGARVLLLAVCVQACSVGSDRSEGRIAEIGGGSTASCLGANSFLERVSFATASAAGEILGEPDEWARQLSRFEMAARMRATRQVALEEFLTFLGGSGLSWTPSERDYWQQQVAQVSAPLAGLNVRVTDVALVKTSGREEFNFAYSRNDAIMIPDGRVQIAGDERRDFFFLAHEVFHYLSALNPVARDSLFGLLGFKPLDGFAMPSALEARRLSNPGSHSYQHALSVKVDSQSYNVVPVIQSRVPLGDLAQLPEEGRSPLLDLIDVVLVAVDTSTGEARSDASGRPLVFHLDQSDWASRLERNTSYAIHPEEVIADNFALFLEWRSTGVLPSETPAGTPVNDTSLLLGIRDVLTSGCEL